MNAHVAHILNRQEGQKLSDLLKVEFGLSQFRIDRLFELGAIYASGVRMREDQELKVDEDVRVHFRPKRFVVPEKLTVIEEDQDMVCIDKPFGLPTHPTVDNFYENAWYAMQKQMKHRLFVTHRLDTGTQGVLILAKTPEGQVDINRLFQDRRVKKIYRALTATPPPLGRFEHFMNVDVQPPKLVYATNAEGLVPAILTIHKVWEVGEEVFASEIELETGRTHQIRAQLAFLECPILGDHRYGSKKKFVHERLALECFQISLTNRSRTIGISRPTSITTPQNAIDFQMSSPT